MKRHWIRFVLVSCLAIIGSYVALASTGSVPWTDNPTVDDFPIAACTPSYQDGDISGPGGLRTFVQTVDSSDNEPYYTGPFLSRNPCVPGGTLYGFSYDCWYDNDFRWKHIFVPTTAEPGEPCLRSAVLYICAWDVDQQDCEAAHPNDPGFCEHDRIYGDDVPLTPAYLLGNNQTWSTTAFDVPIELLADGELVVRVDVDAYSTQCNWTTALSKSQLVVDYAMNQPPYTPQGIVTRCVTIDSALCVMLTPQNPEDPDGDPVEYDINWFFNAIPAEWFPIDWHQPCYNPPQPYVGEQFMVTVTARDSCGAESEPFVGYFTIVETCDENPFVGYDYGDLDPECYPTSVNGPANPVQETPLAWLGPEITAEQFPNIVNLDGADDGVVFVRADEQTSWVPCEEACIDVTVSANQRYTGPLYLYGWKDGNLDCDFDDYFCDREAWECIIPCTQVVPGTQRICFLDPGEMIGQGRYDGVFRFRLLSRCQSVDSALVSIDPLLGETEDYVIHDLQLPVELISFFAVQDARTVLLSWATASETGSDHFVVERKTGSEAWEAVSPAIQAAGQSATRRNYSYRDEGVVVGLTYEYQLVAIDLDGTRRVLGNQAVVMSADDPALITEYHLYPNYPNPFNPTTTITFDLKEATEVTLSVFDVMGRQVAELVNGKLESGRHTSSFDAAGMPSGLYIYRLTAGDFSAMNKMILLK